MKINEIDLPRPQGVQTKKTGKSNQTSKASGSTSSASSSSSGTVTDSVSVSAAGQQLKAFRTQYKAIPDDIRTERLAALKDEVSQGGYHPPAEKIANAIIDFVQFR